MEFEERNKKPQETNSGLPAVVLFVLIGIICLMLYAGWHLMSDDASKIAEFENSETLKKDDLAIDNTLTEEAPDLSTSVIESEPNEIKEEQKINLDNKIEEKVESPAELNENVHIHTVKENETFFGIGNKYNIGTATLKKYNPDVNPNGIKVGVTKIKVPIQAVHTVGPGDILRVVSEKYNISVDLLMSANGKTKNFSERGEKLVIPFAKKQ
jgi:LysM repeat protein